MTFVVFRRSSRSWHLDRRDDGAQSVCKMKHIRREYQQSASFFLGKSRPSSLLGRPFRKSEMEWSRKPRGQ